MSNNDIVNVPIRVTAHAGTKTVTFTIMAEEGTTVEHINREALAAAAELFGRAVDYVELDC